MGGIRTRIVNAARDELNQQSGTLGPLGPISQHWLKTLPAEKGSPVRGGWQRLSNIFMDAVQGFASPNDPSFKNAMNGLPMGKSWCGIFATHVLRSASMDAKWTLVSGTMFGGDVRRLLTWTRDDLKNIPSTGRSAENLYIEPGDVVTLTGATNHHCVVVGIDATRKRFDTIEGNTEFQEIRAGNHAMSSVTSIYKVVKETKFPRLIFEGIRTVPPAFLSALVGTWKVTNGANTWYYTFSSTHKVDWGSSPHVKEGSGLWSATGATYIKIAWQPSGSIELWDWNSGSRGAGVPIIYFYKGDPAVQMTATKG
jgi:hypothetical protein